MAFTESRWGVEKLHKGPFMEQEVICYCFGYTAEDIRKDVLQHGRSLIMERIAAEKKAGGCNCGVTNPKGR